MRKKGLLLVGAMTLSGYAHADRIPENLKNFTVSDICPVDAYVDIDGEESEVDQMRIKNILKDQDTLFNIGFNQSNYSTCTQGAYIIFESLKTSSGQYVFATSLRLFSRSDATINKGSNEIKIKALPGFQGAEVRSRASSGLRSD